MNGAHGSVRASLAAGAPEVGSGPWLVSGVLIGENERVHGKHGRKSFPADEQKKAVESLVGTEFSVEHEGDAVPVGTVTDATYSPGVGTVYEAECEDYATAAALHRGELGVSLEASVPDASHVGRDTDGTAYMKDYTYRRVACVPTPASKAATSDTGPLSSNSAVAALESAGSVNDLVAAALGRSDDDAIRAKRRYAREQFGVSF